MRSGIFSIFRLWAVVVLAAFVLSCNSDGYQDIKFGGMNGNVQSVTVTHREAEVWHVNERGTDVMYKERSSYDMDGYEISSARLDPAGHVESEAENIFENGVCLRSSQKVNGRVVACLTLLEKKKGQLEYNSELNGRIDRMIVKKRSFGRRHKTTVIQNGVVTSISVMRTDRDGYPVKITETDAKTGSKIIQVNVYDENHNITKKSVTMDGEEKDQIVYTNYSGYDAQGNWTEARTFNRNHLPIEILEREIIYW